MLFLETATTTSDRPPYRCAQYCRYMESSTVAPAARGPRGAATGLRPPGRSASGCSINSGRRSTPAIRCSCTGLRQRQDRHLTGDPQPSRRRHLHSACARGRRQHHPAVRCGQSISRCPSRRRRRSGPGGGRRPALGRCRRPMITVGGELSLDQLEAELQPRTRASTARRCRRWRMAACSSSTTSAGRPARHATC